MKQLELKKTIYFILIFICLIFTYVNFKSFTSTFDNKLREYFFEIRGEVETTNQVIIIDIDEKSIDTIGQWPFPRDFMAQALINLTNAQIGMMGMDIIFSEHDRSSPSHMAEVLGVQGEFQNNDKVLGQVVANTPTILGYFFTQDLEHKSKPAPIIDAKVESILKNNQNKSKLITSSGVVTNISEIQDYAYSSGFFNAYNSSHGKITKMPMVLSYENKIYPSLTLEMIRIALGSQKIEIHEDEFGIKGLKLNDLYIPTDENAFMSINFRGAKNSFKYYSFVDIVQGNFDPEEIKGKIALFGTSAITLADLRAMVYDLAIPGVEIHANIIDNILKGDFLYEPSFAVAIETITIFLLTIVLGLIYLRVNALAVIPLFMLITTSLYGFFYYLLFQKGIILDLFYPLLALILTTVIAQILNYSKESQQKNIIKDKFSKKVSPAVVNDLLTQSDNQFKGVKKEVTVFFSDIRDFTPLSEKLDDPQELIKVLNLYMEPMADEIIKTNGTIDKFIGDAIMAYWNAPQNINKHADCAVSAALKQLESLKELNKHLEKNYDLTIDIGIGIHTGIVTVGEMGSTGRSDYTIIGDNVNLASRIEGLTKKLGAKILITDDTKEQLEEDYIFKELAYVEVKGKTNAVLLYEVISFKNKKPKNFDEINSLYISALKLYKNQEFKKAKDLFENIDKKEEHYINKFYINACEKYINNSSERFQLSFNFTSK